MAAARPKQAAGVTFSLELTPLQEEDRLNEEDPPEDQQEPVTCEVEEPETKRPRTECSGAQESQVK